jgi:small GTP-binding protein
MTDNMSQTYKVVIVGDAATGKTSILNRYISGNFDARQPTTIGVEFCHKHVNRDTKLTFWDTAGQERYQSIMSTFYRGAHAIMFVYDMSNRDSFLHLEQWWREYHAFGNTAKSVAILVGNKCDLPDRRVSAEEARAWAVRQHMLYAEVSAKQDIGIEKAFDALILRLHDLPEVQRETVRLQTVPKSDRCCYS